MTPTQTATRVYLVNPLAGALHHYTEALAATLRDAGADVTVLACDEPSRSGRARHRWVADYVRMLRRVRHADTSAGQQRSRPRLIVTWPVLGYLDLAVLAAAVGPAIDATLVMHDPAPLVRSIGHGRVSRILARFFLRGRGLLVHSEVAQRAVMALGMGEGSAVLPLPLSPEAAPTCRIGVDQAPERRVLRVLGQYKADRDIGLMERLGRSLADPASAASDGAVCLEVHGRGWPDVAGWSVTDAFVSEDRLDALISSSTAVLLPYRRFYQSDIAMRSLEAGTPVVGSSDSSLAELYPLGDPLLVSAGADDDVSEWLRAIDHAADTSRGDIRRLARELHATNVAGWKAWLLASTPDHTAPAFDRTPKGSSR